MLIWFFNSENIFKKMQVPINKRIWFSKSGTLIIKLNYYQIFKTESQQLVLIFQQLCIYTYSTFDCLAILESKYNQALIRLEIYQLESYGME